MPDIETKYDRKVWMAEVKRRRMRLAGLTPDDVQGWKGDTSLLSYGTKDGRNANDLLFPEEKHRLLESARRSVEADRYPRKGAA